MRHRVRFRRRRLAIVGIITIIVVCSSAFLFLSSNAFSRASNGQSQLAPWAFPGAYVNYTGSTMLLGKVRYTMFYDLKVLDVSGKQAEVRSLLRFQIGSEQPTVYQHVAWHNATSYLETSGTYVGADSLAYSYDGNVTIGGKTIPVIVDVYHHFGAPDISITAWRSKAVGLPVQLRFSFDNASVTLPLVKTNIPGLAGQVGGAVEN